MPHARDSCPSVKKWYDFWHLNSAIFWRLYILWWPLEFWIQGWYFILDPFYPLEIRLKWRNARDAFSDTHITHTFQQATKSFLGDKNLPTQNYDSNDGRWMTFNVAFNLLFAEISLFEGRLENLNFSISNLKSNLRIYLNNERSEFFK